MEPHADDIRRQLDRMLASGTFATTDRLRRFLRFVVERTLAGEGAQLKEYVVGVGVFDRDEQYDPRTDAIVRVEAGRLRAKMDEYYRSANGADPVVIRLPKGSYAPVFEFRAQATAAAAPDTSTSQSARSRRWPLAIAAAVAAIVLVALAAWGGGRAAPASAVTMAVLPFDVFSADPELQQLAARITDGVTSEAARIGAVGVVSHTSARQLAGNERPAREIAATLGADLLLEGTIDADGDRVRVSLRLVDGVVDRKVWVDDVEGNRADMQALCRTIAASAVDAAGRVTR